MVIDRVYQLVLYILNKEQRGDVPPEKFNILAEMAQLEYISKRVGNLKITDQRGLMQFGYESSFRVHADLQPMIVDPETINLFPDGRFPYPYGYIWPDAVTKTNFRKITRITNDQYPHIKHSVIKPPTENDPIVIFRHPYGFVDPYSIGSIKMSYVKTPPIPRWGYGLAPGSDRPIFDANLSVDFSVYPLAWTELAMLILQHCGINLSEAQITAYAAGKEAAGV